MKRIVLLLFVAVAFSANAQYNQSTNQRRSTPSTDRKVYFGIGGGLGFGTGYNYYSILPVIGYRVTDQFSVGASFTYQRYNYTSYGYSFTQYGAGPYLRYNFNSFFVQTEYDVINAPTYNSSGTEIIHANYSRSLWGIGYNFTQGSRLALVGVVMYDILYRPGSVFDSPIVTRVYLTF